MEHLFNETDYSKTLGSKVSDSLYQAYKKIAQSDKTTISEAVRRSLINEANSRIASTNEFSNSKQELITHPSFNYTATSKPFFSHSNGTKPLYYKKFLEEVNQNKERIHKDINMFFEVGRALYFLFPKIPK